MISFYCWYCGNDLELKEEGVRKETDSLKIPIEPCQTCLQSEKSVSYDEGYKECDNGK